MSVTRMQVYFTVEQHRRLDDKARRERKTLAEVVRDALKRRCLYHWIDYPSVQREIEIVRARLPGVDAAIGRRVSHGAPARVA